MWTLTEVMKLVDGISEYGVGRWTDIKRLLFSTTVYRTPIDLRVFFHAFSILAVVLVLQFILPSVDSAGQMAKSLKS